MFDNAAVDLGFPKMWGGRQTKSRDRQSYYLAKFSMEMKKMGRGRPLIRQMQGISAKNFNVLLTARFVCMMQQECIPVGCVLPTC